MNAKVSTPLPKRPGGPIRLPRRIDLYPKDNRNDNRIGRQVRGCGGMTQAEGDSSPR
jgi:hypothetical protein